MPPIPKKSKSATPAKGLGVRLPTRATSAPPRAAAIASSNGHAGNLDPVDPYWTTSDGETVKLYLGNVIDVLRRLPAKSVHMAVTSPPYWALRDYGTGSWEGGDEACDHIERTAESCHKTSTLGSKKQGHPVTNAAYQAQVTQYKHECAKCGARRVDHQLGSEERPDCLAWARGENCADPGCWVGGWSGCDHRNVETVDVEGQQTGAWHGGDPKCEHKQEAVGGTKASYSPQHGKVMSRPAGWQGSPRCSTVKPTKACVKCGAQRLYTTRTVERCVDCGAVKGCWDSACHVCRMVLVFRELRRVLRDDGTLWLNYGDTYSSGVGNNRNGISSKVGCSQKANNPKLRTRKPRDIPSGNLVGVPWRVALALQADGWILRQDIQWAKKSPMPESVRNRCTKAHEPVFLFCKRMGYYFDVDGIREKSANTWNSKAGFGTPRAKFLEQSEEERAILTNKQRTQFAHTTYHSDEEQTGRNKRDVWEVEDHRALLDWMAVHAPDALRQFTSDSGKEIDVWSISSQGYEGSHFATFPCALIDPCVLAGTSAHGACGKCGAPWKRTLRTCYVPMGSNGDVKRGGVGNDRPDDPTHKLKGKITPQEMRYGRSVRVDKQLGWEPTCTCHGHFVEEEADALYYGAWSDGEERAHGNVAWKDGDLAPQVIRKKVPVYVPDIPLEEHPVVPCVVLDPFIGSGTSCVVALDHGRRGVGIDLSEKYLRENAVQRIEGRLRALGRAHLTHRPKTTAVRLAGVRTSG